MLHRFSWVHSLDVGWLFVQASLPMFFYNYLGLWLKDVLYWTAFVLNYLFLIGLNRIDSCGGRCSSLNLLNFFFLHLNCRLWSVPSSSLFAVSLSPFVKVEKAFVLGLGRSCDVASHSAVNERVCCQKKVPWDNAMAENISKLRKSAVDRL